MSNPQLTASLIELAAKCPGSQAHEHVETTNEAAERGTAIHDYIATLLSRGEAPLPSNHEARTVCERLDPEEIHRSASPAGGIAYRVELGLYLSPASGEGGVLEGSHHRDYSGAPEGSIPGTADVVALEDGRVRVTDWKTGGRRSPPPSRESPAPLSRACRSQGLRSGSSDRTAGRHPRGRLDRSSRRGTRRRRAGRGSDRASLHSSQGTDGPGRSPGL